MDIWTRDFLISFSMHNSFYMRRLENTRNKYFSLRVFNLPTKFYERGAYNNEKKNAKTACLFFSLLVRLISNFCTKGL